MSSATFFPTEVQRALRNVEDKLWESEDGDVPGPAVQVLVDELRRMERRYQAGHPIVVQLPDKPSGKGGL